MHKVLFGEEVCNDKGMNDIQCDVVILFRVFCITGLMTERDDSHCIPVIRLSGVHTPRGSPSDRLFVPRKDFCVSLCFLFNISFFFFLYFTNEMILRL